jgi:energy-coupling factor transport system ATP-binding protein
MIRVSEFTYTYPGAARPALEGVNLEIPVGQLCGVIGANGAGKSTLCYALTGMVPHYYGGDVDGRVELNGVDISQSALEEHSGKIGLVFQNPFNQITGARYSVREEVAFGLENLGIPRSEMHLRVEETLQQCGLDDLADRSPFALSGGQQQRLAIASILAMRPEVLVLDEPTSQLDPVGAREVFSLLHDLTETRHTTVILVEGKLEWLAEYGDRILCLNEGRIVADGPPPEVLSEPWIPEVGVQLSRYTIAAREAQASGLAAKDRPLPLTLSQAVEFFQI